MKPSRTTKPSRRSDPRVHRPALQYHKGRYNMVFYDAETQKRKTISLRTDDQHEAEERYWKIYDRYRDGSFDPHRSSFRGTTALAEAVTVYLAQFEAKVATGRLKPSTFRERRIFLCAFVDKLPAGLVAPLVTPEDCDTFVVFGKRGDSTPMKRSTQLGYYQKLVTFWIWAVGEGYVTTSPMEEGRAAPGR